MRNFKRSNGAIAAPVIIKLIGALLLVLGTDQTALSSPITELLTDEQQEPPLKDAQGMHHETEGPAAKTSDLGHQPSGHGQEQHHYPQHHIQLPSKNIQPHASFLTMDKKAHLSGIRIEPIELGETGFIGYTEKGVSIVAPHTPVRVVLFGSFLDDIALIGFTSSENCSLTLANIQQEDFTIQTERRIVIIYEFDESKSIYKMCLRQKVSDDVYELPFSLVDDLRCSVSTDMPPRKYYFPFAIQISIVAALLVLSGLFSGLNLGLMSLTPQELTLISNSGSLKERKYAQTILPVRKSGNLLLCSLLIGNVCVNSAISILFDDLTSGYVALVVSSAGIVVFGEIFPQALCVKKGLAVGAHTIWVTRFFMVLTFPLAYPISRILDNLLGDEVVSYDRKRLMELIRLSTKNAIGCPAEELKIAIGAFEMGDKTVRDVMTKIDDVFMIPQDTVLNAKVVAEILRSGYTRIPVYANTRDNVVSLLFVKDLALLDPDDNFVVKTVCDYYQHPVRRVPENTPLRSMLEEFKKGDYHMALVDRMVEMAEDKDMKYELVGLVTLEDIVEEILQAEIVDETDVVTDNVNRTRRRKNHRRDLDLFIDDGGACQISMQMQLVTIQYLEGNFRAFSPDRIAQSILEKVIRAHVHKVEVSHLTDLNDPKTALPRKAKLYTKKQTSDKFVLILEGRALVTIGQNEMTFEVGPWQCFGTELLNQLDLLIDLVEQQQSSNTMSSANPLVATIKTVTSAAGALGKSALECGNPCGRTSHGALPGIMPATSISVYQQPLVDLIGQDAAKKIKFVPDYSVKILSECTYLEISVQTYLAMYRSTALITHNKDGADGLAPAAPSIATSGVATATSTTTIGVPSASNNNTIAAADVAPIEVRGEHAAHPTANNNHQSNVAGITVQQHSPQQQHERDTILEQHLVDSAPIDYEMTTAAGSQQQDLDGAQKGATKAAINAKRANLENGLDLEWGENNIGGIGKRKRIDNPSATRHRRTNSDTQTGLLMPNGGITKQQATGGVEDDSAKATAGDNDGIVHLELTK